MLDSETIQDEYVLEMRHIRKEFPGVLALKDVDFTLKKGEVHALLGENGAGKSTLIKIITGAYKSDGGEVKLYGESLKIDDPITAQNYGISAVYQEFNLIPYLDAAQNIYLRKQPLVGKKLKFIDKKTMYENSERMLKELGININVKIPVRNLSVAYQQMVEIAKALVWNSKIIIFDEPTAVITEEESEKLFKVIRTLKEKGVAIIYISHRLEELNLIGDRATILRDGEHIDTFDIEKDNVDIDAIIRKMVGRDLVEKFPKVKVPVGEEILSVEHLTGDRFKDISFQLHRGEILGITGLVGAGRTEIVKAIFGDGRIISGDIFFNGKKVKIKDPTDAIKLGISLVPEDRKNEGLVQILSIENNIILANQRRFLKGALFSNSKIKKACNDMVGKMRIVTSGLDKQVKFLSGGNQQKVVLAKWLTAYSQVVIFDEPTRGIDVGAKVEVYNLMNQLVENGVGIIMISSELPEVLGMSDRIIVLYEGKMTAELMTNEADQDRILKFATGGGIVK